MFNEKDLLYFEQQNISVSLIEAQLENFRHGFPYLQLIKPAIPGDGIVCFNEPEIASYIKIYETFQTNAKIVKFVPASGAASRMFKDMYTFLELYDGNKAGYSEFMKTSGLNAVTNIILNIHKFAFYDDLKQNLENRGLDIQSLIQTMNLEEIFLSILEERGLNYGALPKALLKFHKYREKSRTALEEHLAEGAEYAKGQNGKVDIHFTVSQNHVDLIRSLINEVSSEYEEKYAVQFGIELSQQKRSTDIIAVDMNNNPFRDNDGKIVFRPGGHGALIENLNDIDADLIFIKNIDNVVPDYLRKETIKYKKLIAGLLISTRQRLNDYIGMLDAGVSQEKLKEIEKFLLEKLSVIVPGDVANKPQWIRSKLNRPLRVCGMVKNEGEPGGGPFWVMNDDGSISLQIVESSQVDKSVEAQKSIVERSTHFNPVDIVCCTMDYRNNKFDLRKFIDTNTGFISKKSKDGVELKAQELPGLWNGAMADWNTIFVEVPLITFNPVKTINDFLRKEHQPE